MQEVYAPAVITHSPARIDGRTARAARTRAAVANACLELIEEGHLRPTARLVSERAGVSLRSVFQHFEDMESLLAAAADRQVERFGHIEPIPPHTPLSERLDRFVEGRARLLESITPVRRAAVLLEPFSREIATRLEWARDLARNELAAVFHEEIQSHTPDDRAQLLAAVDTAASWYVWETLRRYNALSPEEARRAMRRTLAALLKEDA